MPFEPLPASAAWLHREARSGFEVSYFRPADDGYLLSGCTTALEDGGTWIVEYDIRVDARWCTRHARVRSRTATGVHTAELEADGAGTWRVNGRHESSLDGCRDVDLESSALTNTLPVHRLALRPAEQAEAPAAYVRAQDLAVERLEQTYRRLEPGSAGSRIEGTGIEDDRPARRYHYAAQAFDFTCELGYDNSGLVLTYPGIAVRAA